MMCTVASLRAPNILVSTLSTASAQLSFGPSQYEQGGAMNTKLRIKMGAVEVEYEGSDDFLKKELPGLLKAVLALHAKAVQVKGTSHPNRRGLGTHRCRTGCFSEYFSRDRCQDSH